MSSAYVGSPQIATNVLRSILPAGIAPFVFLALPAAILGKAILSEIKEYQKECAADSVLKAEDAPPVRSNLGEAIREQIQTLLDGEKEKINGIKSLSAQKTLIKVQEQLEVECAEQLTTGNVRDLDVLFRELRVKVNEAQIEERSWATSLKDFGERCRAEHSKAAPEKQSELERLQTQAEALTILPFDERFDELMKMMGQLRSLADEKMEISTLKSKDIRDILDCAERIAQIDPQEREKLLPLLEELEHPSPFESRISMIGRQVRLTYAAVREKVAQTISFKEELGPILPLISLIPTGETLAERIQTALESKYIERNRFLPLYEEARQLLARAQEELADTLLTEKVSSILGEMGYELDAPEAKTWKPGQIAYLNSPYDGYNIMVKISEKKDVAIRLVRRVASEAERENVSAYQRQKDADIGKKWCADLDKFLGQMRELGVPLDTVVRQEPHEAPLQLVVDSRLAEENRARGDQARGDELVRRVGE